MTIGDDWLIPGLTVLVNAAVTWGVMSTKLQWLRSDVARMERDLLEVRRELREMNHAQTSTA